jgi:hypothetical protein
LVKLQGTSARWGWETAQMLLCPSATLGSNREEAMHVLTDKYIYIYILVTYGLFLTLTLMMQTEQVFKTLVFNSTLTQLITQEDFSAFIC